MPQTSQRILWLDNDSDYVFPLKAALRRNDYEVDVVTSVLKAEEWLRDNSCDLLILDVMIPTWNAEEEALYPPAETDRGHRTGLVFYRRMKTKLLERKTPVLVMTIRRDREILKAFVKEGLPPECFSTKFVLRNPEDFLSKVNETLTVPNASGS